MIPNGVLAIDKPAGITSRDAVDRLQRRLRRVKIGHAGTLDPLATGVLVICVGAATRLIRLVQQLPKQYEAEFLLGQVSDTDDIEGEVREVQVSLPDEQAIRGALPSFVGLVEQRPPAFSAIKVNGKRAYDLARRGHHVELEQREVRIDRLQLRDYEPPRLRLHVRCGSGVYIRAIGRDLGEALGCGAVMSRLARTAIGGFTLDSATPLDQLASESAICQALLPPLQAAEHLPPRILDDPLLEAMSHGQFVPAADVQPDLEYAVLDQQGVLRAVALGLPGGRLRPTINLKEPSV